MRLMIIQIYHYDIGFFIDKYNKKNFFFKRR